MLSTHSATVKTTLLQCFTWSPSQHIKSGKRTSCNVLPPIYRKILSQRNPALGTQSIFRPGEQREKSATVSVFDSLRLVQSWSSDEQKDVRKKALKTGPAERALVSFDWLGPQESRPWCTAACGQAVASFVRRRRTAGLVPDRGQEGWRKRKKREGQGQRWAEASVLRRKRWGR